MYLLDTCAISDLFSGVGKTQERVKAVSPSRIAISAVTTMEVLYGFQLSSGAEKKFAAAFRELCAATKVLPFDEPAAALAARIRAELKERGTPIGPWDLLIAATAVANGCILVSSNLREFNRIPDLAVEDWK
jgi:tRNA(fMet)-specific endonuclease VapC